ncbi:MAG: hypothetical protein HQK93_07215 [Nitrospirae bacterium]|nr:hypothetical protein [Nitrospirota bacterium]
MPNRSDILLHWGNFPRDTHGCVLIGEEFGEIEGQDAILNSHKAFRNFMTMLSGSMSLNWR